jgi:hypothetical protein
MFFYLITNLRSKGFFLVNHFITDLKYIPYLLKIIKHVLRAGSMSQLVEHLLSNIKALSSNPGHKRKF